MPRIPVADLAGSERAVAEAMTALYETQITGEGRIVRWRWPEWQKFSASQRGLG